MKRRSAADFIRIVKRKIKEAPKAPVRLDVYPDEIEAIRETFEALNAKNRKKVPWGWTYRQHPTTESMLRAAFYGPDIQRAFKVIETQLGRRKNDEEAVNKERQRLKEEYPGCRVEFVITGSRNQFEVWRGEDYLFTTRAPLNGLEASDENDRVKQAQHDAMKASDKYELLAKKETNRREGQKKAKNENKMGRKRGTWHGKTLDELAEEFIADAFKKKPVPQCRGENVGKLLSEKWDFKWKPGTIRKALAAAYKKRKQ